MSWLGKIYRISTGRRNLIKSCDVYKLVNFRIQIVQYAEMQ